VVIAVIEKLPYIHVLRNRGRLHGLVVSEYFCSDVVDGGNDDRYAII